MLLREADVHEQNGKNPEAAKIRAWVADLLSEQSKIVRSVGRQFRKPSRATLYARLSHFPRATAIAGRLI
jgi:hypothetical protein